MKTTHYTPLLVPFFKHAVFTCLLFTFYFTLFTPSVSAATQNASSAYLHSGSTLNNGLVGLWTLDGKDVVSGKVKDRSGQGNDGSPSGIATSTFYSSGKLGQAFNFDGSNDYIDLGSPSALNISGSFTMSAWVRTNTVSAYQAVYNQMSTANNLGEFQFRISDTGKLQFFRRDSQGATSVLLAAGVTALSTGTWYHLVGTYDGTTYTVYINSVSDVSTTGSASNYTASAGAKTTIGAAEAAAYPFNGIIDDVRVYNRALTAAEVKQLYQLGGGQSNASSAYLHSGSTLTNGLIGLWTFDGKDISNGTALDKSGQGNTMKFSNIATSTFYKTGKLGQGISFDGSDDYATSTITSNSNNALTQALWLYIRKLPSESPATFQGLFQKYPTDSWNLFFRASPAQLEWKLQFASGTGNSSTRGHVAESALTKNAWNHIVATYDGTTDTEVIYINGVQQATASLGLGALSATENNMNFGTNVTMTGSFLDGIEDDIRVYNRALTAAEVKQLYQLGGGQTNASSGILTNGSSLTSGLVGLWTFDGKDVVSGKVKDRSGNGYDGSPSGIATSTFYSTGKLGQAGNFDGTNDLVKIADTAGLQKTTITFTAWIFPTSSGAVSMIGRDHTEGGSAFKFYLNSSVPTFDTWNSSGTLASVAWGSTVPLNQWSFISASTDGSTMSISVNGGTAVTATGNTISYSGSYGYAIGANRATPTDFFSGRIDDLRIYNRVLTAAEIKQLYLMGR